MTTTTVAYTAGQRVIHQGRPATVLSTGRGRDTNAVTILTDGASVHIDTRACFLTPAAA